MPIEDYISSIRTATYGRDVRSAIADGISECYSDVQEGITLIDEKVSELTTAKNNAETATTQAQQAVNDVTDAINNINGYLGSVATVDEIKNELWGGGENAGES